ncbi:hypothetical protein [uncultured Sutterella sp.]|uniref:hypothetical protein n=1 Tax=uncultured Sutterella sp. TaxID=286133 RepID=UPI0025D48900|nr:hypothetical protein [uncultured Sutterella sp.]
MSTSESLSLGYNEEIRNYLNTKVMTKSSEHPKNGAKIGRPVVYPQGRRIVTLSLPSDTAAKLKALGNSKFVKTAVDAAYLSDHADLEVTRVVSLAFTEVEYERFIALGGKAWLLACLKEEIRECLT